jgi:predicted methyltransferase
MNALLDKRLKEAGIDNVETILGTDDDPKLPPASIDWIQLVDTYHEFQKPEAMLAKLRAALKPGGKVALIEYRLHGDTATHIKEDHRMSVKQVLTEWNQAGFMLVDLLEFLPTQHFFVFEARPDCPEK